jgi:hypothetical protein
MAKSLYKSVTGTSNVLSAHVSQSHGNAVAVATVNAESTSLGIGDAISIDIGYSTDHSEIFTGYVKRVERIVPDNTYIITAHDELVRAVDYFIASTNPENPFTRYRIQAEDLIEDLLNLAGITNYSGATSNFTYAWTIEAEINLVGCYEFCSQLADMLAWHLYADTTGKVHFLNRRPYVMGGDSAIKTITDTTIISVQKTTSDEDLRNRVVIYGSGDVYAEAKSASPYLPSGFYKTAVLSSPIIDRQSTANQAASYNLDKWNRLTTALNLSVEGDPDLVAREVIHVHQTDLSINSDWYIYGAEHHIDQSGYTIGLELRQ